MKPKIRAEYILITITILVISGCASQTPQPFTIGVITPLTGFGAYWGSAVQSGMNLAIEELPPNQIHLIFEDSQANPTISATAAKKLIEVDRVNALYVDFTAPSQSTAPIAAASNVSMYYNSFDEEPLRIHPAAVKVFFDARTICREATKIASTNNLSTIAYIGPMIPIVPQCVDELRKRFLGTVLVETMPSPQDADYRTALSKLQSQGAQLLVSLAYENNYLAILKQKSELGFVAPMVCTAAECYSEKIKKSIPIEANEGNTLVGLNVLPEFTQRFTSKNPNASSTVIAAAAFGYDAVHRMARAALACPTQQSTCLTSALISDREYHSAIASTGFTSDRKEAIHMQFGIVHNGVVIPYDAA